MVVKSTKNKINKEISLRRIKKTYCPVASTLPNHAVILFLFAFGLGGVHLLAANWDLE
jgi:hypothetical protein